jgi:diaminopimelate epimerase
MNLVRVEMGKATFTASEIPMEADVPEAVGIPLDLGRDTGVLTVTAVSVGNPHCVVFTKTLDKAIVRRIGPLLERHSVFPNRTNVQFAKPVAADALDIMIWERGAGWTLASGTSSCAAAAAAVRNGHCLPGPVRVSMPGGELTVDVRADWSLRMEGPVESVCEGTITAEFVEQYLQGQ